MDFTESTKAVYNRIQKLEPENVSKIIGYLLLQDHASTRPVSSPASMRAAASPFWDPQMAADQQQQVNSIEFVQPGYSDTAAEDFCLQNQMQFLTLEDQFDSVNSVNSDFSSSYFYPEPALGHVRTSRRSPSLPEFPVKVCHYFNKGFCKHGNNCRYFHGHPMPESFSQIFSPNANDIRNEDHVFSPGSLERLEAEITELLKQRRGFPISIASLPMMYYEKYGKTLQAEGYLTESQRHGKAGYSLTKLLARLKNSIRLIDRPHGQHSVILAEDVPNYLEYSGEKSDPGGIVAVLLQNKIKFGPVQDVRIPCQQKRMFGFVTFVFAETVKQILAKGNPHFVCGARVLVKPYREKSRLVDRKYVEKMQHPLFCSLHFTDGDTELHTMPRVCNNSRLLRKQLMEEHEQAIELERRRLSEMQLACKPMNHHSYFGYSMDELQVSEAPAEQGDFPSAERFNYLLDVLNNGSTSEDQVSHISTHYNDQDSSQGLNLPESPFASPIGSGISTVI
ncbi:hypothetical protein CUMW_146960 [Citrus unshiu]|nr:hypothetical protein CUMW_146960 [Citrus unshiu]